MSLEDPIATCQNFGTKLAFCFGDTGFFNSYQPLLQKRIMEPGLSEFQIVYCGFGDISAVNNKIKSKTGSILYSGI